MISKEITQLSCAKNCRYANINILSYNNNEVQ